MTVTLLDLHSLRPGSFIEVVTKTRHYQIEFLGGNAIRISGHPEYCPEPVQAQLQGALGKEGLEPGLIESGSRFMFLVDGKRPITTSRVASVRVTAAN